MNHKSCVDFWGESHHAVAVGGNSQTIIRFLLIPLDETFRGKSIRRRSPVVEILEFSVTPVTIIHLNNIPPEIS